MEEGVASTSKSQAQTNETNTNVKTQIENWYKTNIADKGYDEFVSDTIYCNDRTTPGKEATGWSSDTGLGYGNIRGIGIGRSRFFIMAVMLMCLMLIAAVV